MSAAGANLDQETRGVIPETTLRWAAGVDGEVIFSSVPLYNLVLYSVV